MDDLNKIYKETFAKYGIKTGLDFAEELGLISKTARKEMRTKKRGCSTENKAMLCFICPYKYGSRNCKKFRKYHNMKVGLFFSGEDIVSKIMARAMK